MKQPIRYFAIGLLTASLVLLIVMSFFDKPNADAEEQPVDQMIATLQKEGYHVLSSADYITLSINGEPKDTEKDKEENADKDKDTKKDKDKDKTDDKDADKETDQPEVEEPEVHKYTLTIEPNMLGPTISKLLKENKIIDNEDDFNRYLEKEGYAPYLQLGDHKLSSNMSNFELAEAIARKR